MRFHGGKVSAFNRAEGGLRVEIRLPLISRVAAKEQVVSSVPSGRVKRERLCEELRSGGMSKAEVREVADAQLMLVARATFGNLSYT